VQVPEGLLHGTGSVPEKSHDVDQVELCWSKRQEGLLAPHNHHEKPPSLRMYHIGIKLCQTYARTRDEMDG
jgi:hypothetical protein